MEGLCTVACWCHFGASNLRIGIGTRVMLKRHLTILRALSNCRKLRA
jgi:hypothetical protein